ncbi:hypothetical protein [Streptomyces sp. NPDC001205]
MRHTADTITDDELDGLYERLDKLSRAVERASALAERWADSPAPIVRSQAAELLAAVLRASGWEQTDPRNGLTVVPGEAS